MAIAVCMPRPLCAQIDPYPRELIEFGYHKELNGHAPLAGYLYYYRNVPQFVQSNLAMTRTLLGVVLPVFENCLRSCNNTPDLTSWSLWRDLCAQIFVADVVGIGMVRIMGAIMTGIIIAGHTGAAFAA